MLNVVELRLLVVSAGLKRIKPKLSRRGYTRV